MIFRAMAVSAVLVLASLGPAASSSCDQRIANLCPGAVVTETADTGAAQPMTTAQPAAPMKITNGKRATRSARRYRRSVRGAWRHRRGKSFRHAAARKRTKAAAIHSNKKHRKVAEETDEMVGLANSDADRGGDKPLGDGPALGGGIPAEAVAAEAAPAPQPAQNSATGRALTNLGPAFTPIGASTLPSRTFMPVASIAATTLVNTKTVNAPPVAPMRVASAETTQPAPAPAPVAAAPQKPAPAQVPQATASTIGGVEITTLRALFLAFGAFLMAGTAIRMAIG
ncbi:MAG: hypothetical protein AB7O60_16440 [Variibacter sp.]